MTMDSYISRQEAAILLSATVDEVDRYIAAGLLLRFRIRGRYVRVLRAQVDELASVPIEWRRNA